MEQVVAEMSEARESTLPPIGFPPGLNENKGVKDALSLVGQQAQLEKEPMVVTSLIKLKASPNEEKEGKLESTDKGMERKIKAKAHWKRIAREKGKSKSPKSDGQPLSIGSKRVGKLVFKEEVDVSQKKQCTATTTNQNQSKEGSALVAR